MNSIIWRGVSSTIIQGLLISELPPITKPKMRVKETEIDGRDGSIIEELGYESYTKTIQIGLHGNFDIDKVIKYFTGEGDIIFSNEPDKVYKAKICGQINYTKLLRYRKASVPFLVQPYKYKHNEYLRETPTESVQGTSLVINKNAEDKIKSFKIYGKSTQDGTPTPDTPVDIISIGEGGSITVSVVDGTEENPQNFVMQTPNRLRGIPVSSGGNYTDTNGQQWICDEIDIERGVYVRNIETLNGKEISWKINNENYAGNGRCYYTNIPSQRGGSISNRFRTIDYQTWERMSVGEMMAYNRNDTDYIVICVDATINSENALKEWFTANYTEFIHIIPTPIETPLSSEEIALYKAFQPNTKITNSNGASMMVEYFKPFEVFNEGLENSKPIMVLKGSGTVEISVNGLSTFSYTFPEGENEVIIDSEKEDAYLGDVLKNRNMNGEFPILIPRTNKIEWSGDVESISILPRSRWL